MDPPARMDLKQDYPEGMEFTYALRFRFDATNNEAEYEALIAGLRIAEQMGVKNLQANVDSRLVANQVNGTFVHLSKQVLVEELKEKSINEVRVLDVVEEEGDPWMTPIFKYLAEETLPTDMKKARAIRRKSWRFAVINGILYKKYFLGPWLRCVGPLQANYVPREIDEGSCSMHVEAVFSRDRLAYYQNRSSDLVQNIEALEINLDLLEERREEALIREAKSKAKMEKYYNEKVQNTNQETLYTATTMQAWEGPYEVTEALGKGAYILRDRDGNQLPRTWNISNLKKCYVHKM
ncbi:reverse transcriptase domain-containing protein [Tanacetum coccineum]